MADSNIEFCKSRGGTSARDVLITCTIKVVILSCTWVVVFNVPIARSRFVHGEYLSVLFEKYGT